MSTVVVAGALANKVGNGGEAWVRPTWAVGLARLGHDAWLVEVLADHGRADNGGEAGAGDGAGPSAEVAAAWFRATCELVGVGPRAALVHGGRTLVGPPLGELRDVLDDAALVLDHSGHLRSAGLPAGGVHAYVDLDPAFTQRWARDGLVDLGGHDAFVTVGSALDRPVAALDDGRDWVPVLPPVLLDRWTPAPLPDGSPRCTTVGSWRPPYGPLEVDGAVWGIKAHEHRRFLDLPGRVPEAVLAPALAIDAADAADRRALLDAGFELADPAQVAGTPAAFAAFVAGSTAEWSVAQGAYVAGRTGWVSDRSAHYLAAGRPVVVQDTGARLPAGEGHLTFTDSEGAADALRRVAADPDGHAAAARALAEAHLDAAAVLGRLCDRLGVTR